jgi:hypothetical protein
LASLSVTQYKDGNVAMVCWRVGRSELLLAHRGICAIGKAILYASVPNGYLKWSLDVVLPYPPLTSLPTIDGELKSLVFVFRPEQVQSTFTPTKLQATSFCQCPSEVSAQEPF